MHRGSAGIGGSAVDIEVQADDLRHTVDTVLGLIAEDTGQPVADLRRLAARPLVHRRRGPRVRLHRRDRRLVRPGDAGQEAPYRAEREVA
jgi:Protease subunit of ATP-dependent Clp proteases